MTADKQMHNRKLLVVTVLMVSLSLSGQAGSSSVYPGVEWGTRKPRQVGLSPSKLEAFSTYLGGNGLVVRHGYMVYTWGDQSKRLGVASEYKPWLTHLLLKAVEEGKIASLDDPVVRMEPQLGTLNSDLHHKDRKITWRHMANQVSCYGVKEKPGTAFDYSDYNMGRLKTVLYWKVYGATWETLDSQVLHPKVTDPIQCQDNPSLTRNNVGSQGLSTYLFANTDLTGTRVARTDAVVDFNWGSSSPAPSIGPESFSVQWIGIVEAQHNDSYTFYTRTDGGVRLWVGDQLVINRWTKSGGISEYSGSIPLIAGKRYDFTMEYFHTTGEAVVQLRWSSPATPKEIVPASRLFRHLGLSVSMRDCARFGLLYLRRGNWKGVQLISEEHATMAVTSPVPNWIPRTSGQRAEILRGETQVGGGNNQTEHLGSYSYAWWINGVDREGKRHWRDAPLDTFAALGGGGHYAMFVVPSLDIIVCWAYTKVNDRAMENEALKRLVQCVNK